MAAFRVRQLKLMHPIIILAVHKTLPTEAIKAFQSLDALIIHNEPEIKSKFAFNSESFRVTWQELFLFTLIE